MIRFRRLRQTLSLMGVLGSMVCAAGYLQASTADASPANCSTRVVSPALSAARVWVLSGERIDSNRATVNERQIDTTSVDSIARSAAAILSSRGPANILGESDSYRAADVSVDFTAPGQVVSRLFHGLNLQWQSKDFLSFAKYRALVSQIRVDTLRFPGGQERGVFDANAQSSAHDDLGRHSRYQFRLTGEDVRRYIDLCREQGIEAQIEVNLTNNDPAMAAGLVDYVVNTLRYDLRYVSMGNEPEIDLFDSWKYWEAFSREQVFTRYLVRYQAYAQAIRSIKPDLTLIFGEFTNPTAGEMEALFKPIGGQLGGDDRPGAFSVHRYASGDWGQAPGEPDYPVIEHFTGGAGLARTDIYAELFRFMRQQADTRLGGGQLFVGEHGVSWSPQVGQSTLHDSIAAVLFNAETLETGKALGFDGMQWFGLSDPTSSSPWWSPSLIAVQGDTMTLRPQYYLYFLYKHLWGDVSIPVDGQHRTSELSIYASRKGDQNYLMLINRMPDQVIERVIQVRTTTGQQKLILKAPAHSVSVIRL